MVQQLSELSDENSERFRRILEIKIEEVLEQSQTVQEHNLIKKKRDKLKAVIQGGGLPSILTRLPLLRIPFSGVRAPSPVPRLQNHFPGSTTQAGR